MGLCGMGTQTLIWVTGQDRGLGFNLPAATGLCRLLSNNDYITALHVGLQLHSHPDDLMVGLGKKAIYKNRYRIYLKTLKG